MVVARGRKVRLHRMNRFSCIKHASGHTLFTSCRCPRRSRTVRRKKKGRNRFHARECCGSGGGYIQLNCIIDVRCGLSFSLVSNDRDHYTCSSRLGPLDSSVRACALERVDALVWTLETATLICLLFQLIIGQRV